MKATETKLLEFLKKSEQFAIPIYQRTYSWMEAQCRQLWEDILRAGNDDDIPTHFLGSIVYIEKGLYQITSQAPMLVIDGQQRLSTVSLIIEALARHVGDTEPLDGFSSKKLSSYYLMNPLEKGERKYKLLLTQTDNDTLCSIIDRKPMPDNHSRRLEQNFEFFQKQIRSLNNNIEPLCKGLSKLVIVDISLDRTQDNPQLIFESMNSTGLELSQADLIRNFILMGLEHDIQKRLYKEYWRPMETTFGQENYDKHFNAFMRHYLTIKSESREAPKIRRVYEAFKKYARNQRIADAGIGNLISNMHKFSGYYCAMALGKETNSVLTNVFSDFRDLDMGIAYPLLLELYHDYAENILSAEELKEATELVESYIFRRAVCDIPTNSLNKTFMDFGKRLNKDRYLESIKAHFQLLPSYRRFPADDEFQERFMRRDLYNFRLRNYWLRKLENYERKEKVSTNEYTIEHIMPQNENLSKKWREGLGENWEQTHDIWLHTPGNLTLTGYNAEYSDRSFTEKRDMKGGFRESPLKLNEGLGGLDIWNEGTIKKRAKKLAKKAACVWIHPSLSDEILNDYRDEDSSAGRYSLDNYEYIKRSPFVRSLFEGLRKEVLAIDPCVTEELRKRYIAYKAETNFVDMLPQSKRLQLILNMQFHELTDPEKIARDTTGLSHWGNGDVIVNLSSHEDIPYIMSLIRQSFDKQMKDESDWE